MSVVVKVMLSLISVMSPPPALYNLSVRTVVTLCNLHVCLLRECDGARLMAMLGGGGVD